MAGDNPVTPDELRCNRHDGRGWRCKRDVMEGKSLCEIHYVQGRLRSSKRKVPEALKLQRPKSNSKSKKKVPNSPPPPPPVPVDEEADNGEARVKDRDHLNRKTKRKRNRPSDEADATDLAEKKTKNKAEELLRSFVKREIEKKKIKKRKAEKKGKDNKDTNVDSVEGDQSPVTRELPYGRMAISPPPTASSAANAASPDFKLGLNTSDCRLVNRRFRSKNIDRPPICTVKAVPYAENGKAKNGGVSAAGGGRRKCHWCKSNTDLTKCLTCKKRDFCSVCMTKRCIDAQEVEKQCLVCRGTCECKTCMPNRLKQIRAQEALKKECKVTKYHSLHYLITLVLPILERSNLEHKMESFPLNYTKELEVSAKEVISSNDSPKISDASLHCSFCASIAREGGKERELREASQRKHPGDNFLYCPSIHDDYEILLSHFQKHWRNSHPVIVRNMIVKASNLTWDPIDLFSTYLNMLLAVCGNDSEEVHAANGMDWFEVDFRSKECFTGSLTKADRHLIQETLKLKAKLSSDLCQRSFRDHFTEIYDALPVQEYTNPWSGLLNLAANLEEASHVPEVVPCIYITHADAVEVQKGELVTELCYSSNDQVNVLVHVSDLQCSGQKINKIKNLIKMKHTKDSGGRDLENGMNRECSEITEDAGHPYQTIEGTPLSKVAASSSCLETIEDLPVDIVKNSPSKVPGSESESDSSNTCSGTGDSHERPEDQLCHLESEACIGEIVYNNEKPSGMQWDIFRRQDTPKLIEYIQKHSDEFYSARGTLKKDADPILEGNIFLDSAHKIMLKEEFKIEPWTFTQKLGEAIHIPAGCPYQTRNLKSCVNVVVGFVSPENAAECIKMNEILCALPLDNKAKALKLEVEKMVVSKISRSIEELRDESIKESPSEDA